MIGYFMIGFFRFITLQILLFNGLCISSIYAEEPEFQHFDHKTKLKFTDCPKSKVDQFNQVMEQLPIQLMELESIKVVCVTENLSYGFSVSLDSTRKSARLLLGTMSRIGEERASYRLKHLSSQQMIDLWHKRGLVHTLTLYAAQQNNWHLNPLFRRANIWDTSGEKAVNQDHWAYSRPLGEQTALYDFVTFAEEWFVKPKKRAKQPDNRIECQSFTKVRAFNHLFNNQAVDVPSRECSAFYRWSQGFVSMDLIFSSPTEALVSSFGHLALLLRTSDGKDPEYEDLVIQYVGLLETDFAFQLKQVLSQTIPMVIEPQHFIHFDRYTRYTENRRIYRFAFNLNHHEFLWVKARLWEQIRRFKTSYSFTQENCAQQILRLLQSVELNEQKVELIDQSGITYSPMGTLSALQAQNLLALEYDLHHSLSEEINQQKLKLEKAIKRAKLGFKKPLPNLPYKLNQDSLVQWSMWLNLSHNYDQNLLRVLEELQDYIAMLAWLKDDVQVNLIPVRVPAMLALKHNIFHQEKSFEDIKALLDAWHAQKNLGRPSKSNQSFFAEQLDTLIENAIDKFDEAEQNELTTFLTSEAETNDTKNHKNAKNPSNLGKSQELLWSSDGSLDLSLAALPIRDGQYITELQTLDLAASLYDEQQGLRRLVLHRPNRDLQILKLRLKQQFGNSKDGYLSVSPLELFSRNGSFGINRLGHILGINAQFAWQNGVSDLEFNPAVSIHYGHSIQLLNWHHHSGELSLGISGEMHKSLKQKLNSQLYAFSSLSLPFSNSLLLWCSVNHLVWGSKSSSPNNNDGLLIRNQIQPPWLRVKLAWLLRGQIRKIFGVRHKNTVMLYAELQTDNLISDQFTFYPSIGLRYQ